MSAPEKIVHVTAKVPESLQKALREKADAAERSVAAEIRIALREYVADEPQPPAVARLEEAS